MQMLPAFPAEFAAVLVTQHMPAAFTPTFAQHLDRCCAMRVKEAEDGEAVRSGQILIAPGSRHLHVKRSGSQLRVSLDDGPKVSGHRPSVDAMFHSLAGTCAPRCIGIVMTGMGNDGAQGIIALKQAGCPTVAQDQDSSVVYGMPRAAFATGCVDHVLPLSTIPITVARLMGQVAAGCSSAPPLVSRLAR
jgi:two-component system chemotaxis response regulator CheB